MKKAITHLKLDQANPSKLQKLDELAAEHQGVVPGYVDWLIAHEVRRPNKYAPVPEPEVVTPLSDRWQQACGIVQSWYSANANVVVNEPSNTPQFDFWLRISTLETGPPVRLPIKLNERAKETLARFPKLCTGVTLNKRDGEWYATLVVERKGPKPQSSQVVGVDIGMVSIVSTSDSRGYGQVSTKLRYKQKHNR